MSRAEYEDSVVRACMAAGVLALFHSLLALQLARFMALLNLTFTLNRIYSAGSFMLERSRCMIGSGYRGESREKHHWDFQREMRAVGQDE